MGLYLNPGNDFFAELVKSDTYVDKTGLIAYMNGQIGKTKRFIASSRPRRFGKTLAVQMLAAYYCKSCDSRKIFDQLAIAGDPSYAAHINKYDVINLDIQWMKTSAIQEIKNGRVSDTISYIHREVIRELREEYPEYVNEHAVSLPRVLADIYIKTGKQFVILIDEWDCVFREDKDNHTLQNEYIDFLRSLFKGGPADKFVKLAYITGILPIKKYGTQSALNNFRELTMTAPGGIAKYIGFTETEVKKLCKEHEMSFAGMEKWYDGYLLSRIGHVYSPNSVMEAIENEDFQNYWSQTETYESLKVYIDMDFDGLKQRIVEMLGGARCRVEVGAFQNDMSTFHSADDVLTLLIHLGYLAYDSKREEAFIPNEEVRSTFVLAVRRKGWEEVYKAIENSEKLLNATIAMDGAAVARILQDVHMKNSSSLTYNNEISLAGIIQVAYYTAVRDYTIIRELPAGEGFADMVFLPKRRSKKPALIVELKWDKTAEGAVAQIKNKKYAVALEDYKGNILLVGISYNKKSKEHQCRIEKYEIE